MLKMRTTPIYAMFRGIFISYILTILVVVIYGLLITFTSVNESYVSTIALVTTAIACILSGFITALAAKGKGLIWGILAGVLYIMFIIFAGYMLTPDFEVSSKVLMTIVLAIAGGGLGGVLGINLR